jgi:hypothetical protein
LRRNRKRELATRRSLALLTIFISESESEEAGELIKNFLQILCGKLRPVMDLSLLFLYHTRLSNSHFSTYSLTFMPIRAIDRS